MNHDYAIKVTVRNNRLLEKMRLAGCETAAALSRASGVSMGTIGAYLGMKKAPLMRRKGEPWSTQALKLACYLRCLPEDLFPPAQLRVGIGKNYAEFTADAADIHQISASLRLMALPADEKMMAVESKQALDKLLSCLSPRAERVLRMRFGLDGSEHTLEDIGTEWNLSRDRIRQIEANALRKLKNAVFADKSIQATLGRRMPRSALGLETVPYTPPRSWDKPVPFRSDVTVSPETESQGAVRIKEFLEKYARGGTGSGWPNPYAPPS